MNNEIHISGESETYELLELFKKGWDSIFVNEKLRPNLNTLDILRKPAFANFLWISNYGIELLKEDLQLLSSKHRIRRSHQSSLEKSYTAPTWAYQIARPLPKSGNCPEISDNSTKY